MELRQLEYFVAVAEEASFTRAAARVHVSQSGVSAQIRALERELGAELFDRSARSARLSGAGEAALGPARAALAAAAAVREAVDEVGALLRGSVAVGMVTACTVTGLFDALAAFRLAHPGVSLTVAEDGSERLAELVRAGNLDLALIGAAGGPPAGLSSLTLISEPLAVAVPPGHPLAGAAGAGLEDLTRYPVICLPPGTGVRAVLDQGCAAAGVRLTVAVQASAPGAVIDLAARGLGVAVLSATMARSAADRLAVVPVTGVEVPATLALIWSPRPGPALRELVRHCREAFGQAAGA